MQTLSGRSDEQLVLSRLLGSARSEFVAIYGRRRVGKTFLVRQFFAGQNVAYFEMVGRFGGDASTQLQIFAESLSTAFYSGVALAAPSNWHEAFNALESAVEARREQKQKVVIFFDELPWIATHRSGCLGALEHFWNAWCSRRSDIILVVCGSAASWMLKRIVNARGGLHNRLTQTLRLVPFTLAESKRFFSDRSIALTDRTIIELYMVLGGVPHYLEHVERGLSVPQVVDRLCLHKDGLLANEFDRLFASLFGSDERYVEVVRALASKRRGMTRNELLEATRIASGGGVTTILQNLEEGGFVDTTIPFGRTSRDRLLRLTDQFTLFHLQWLARRRPKSWQHVRSSPRWRAWAGLAFESVCLQHAESIERALGIAGVHTEVSAWLHPNAQIDLLIDRADDVITICEMKFTDSPFTITKKYAEDLRRKLATFREHSQTRKALHLVFVTSYGVTSNRYASELVDRVLTMDVLLG